MSHTNRHPRCYSINPSVGHAYRHENVLGSTIAESSDDWNSATFGSYEYDAYGVPYTLKTGYFTSRYRFAGRSGSSSQAKRIGPKTFVS